MAIGGRDPSLRHLGMLFTAGAIGQCTDAELLERFARRDGVEAEVAFSALVERHGPMVLGVCRRILGDARDVEDAFQATFLVLARRARSLVLTGPLGPWLHQVAWRTAARSRAAALRRRRHERKAAEMAEVLVEDVGGRDDLGEALHEELVRLPVKYRVPLVLCYLEGLTAEQAARALGWPAGTVRSRLARGRERLRARLVRRGLAPSAAGLIAVLASRSAWSSVPTALLNQTARAATVVGAGRMAAGAVPASILTLTEGVLIEMAMTKWKLVGLCLVVAGVLASGAMVSAQAPGPGGGSSESDRLKVVEAKLDRIMRALEGTRTHTTSAHTSDLPVAGPGIAPRDAAFPNPGSAPANSHAPVASNSGANAIQPQTPPQLPAVQLQSPPSLGPAYPPEGAPRLPNGPVAQYQVTPPLHDARQDLLEQRVSALERRLARVEQLLGSAPGAAVEPGKRHVAPTNDLGERKR